ncbi:MAG: hypothetical protein INF84_15510 [Roseomonas sp.]|nr:hypothetical protein [Roseomonas sp.]
MRVLVLRKLEKKTSVEQAMLNLEQHASDLSSKERADIMPSLAFLLAQEDDALVREIAPKLSSALDVRLPESLRREEPGVFGSFSRFASNVVGAFRSPSPEDAAREFARDFNDINLMSLLDASIKSGEKLDFIRILQQKSQQVNQHIETLILAADEERKNLIIAQELEEVAQRMENVAQQRYAAIMRRAKMLKRHLGKELHALTEDAAFEFEAEFRRINESRKSFFGRSDTLEMNESIVIKILQRRYEQLAARYNDNLDLLSREISEYCEEFTRIGDEALRPIARHEFRKVVPNARLEQRVKNALDSASNKTLVAGVIGAVASGAAVQSGVVTAAALAGAAAAPIGILVLSAVGMAALWKAFSSPGERRKRDTHERKQDLEERLRNEILSNQDRFDQAVEALIQRFRDTVLPDIADPRIEASRLREIAQSQLKASQLIRENAQDKLRRLGLTLDVKNSSSLLGKN